MKGGGGGGHSPLPHCTDSTPKAFPYPNTSPNRISNRQKPPPPTAFTSPVTALQPLWDCPDGPPSPSSKALGCGSGAELRLDPGDRMATGREGNSMPEATGCDPSLCRRLSDAVVVELVDVHWLLQGSLRGVKCGSLAKEAGGRKFLTPLPSQKRLFLFQGEWCLPCWRLPDATQVSAGGCQMQGPLPAGGCGMRTKPLPESSLNSGLGGGGGWHEMLLMPPPLLLLTQRLLRMPETLTQMLHCTTLEPLKQCPWSRKQMVVRSDTMARSGSICSSSSSSGNGFRRLTTLLIGPLQGHCPKPRFCKALLLPLMPPLMQMQMLMMTQTLPLCC